MTTAERAKDKRLQTIYNTTLEKQNEQRAKQLNKCAICHRDFAKFTAFQDHDHQCCPRRLHEFCGKCNRALLCFGCNKFVVGILERQYVDKVRLEPLNNEVVAYHLGYVVEKATKFFEEVRYDIQQCGAESKPAS